MAFNVNYTMGEKMEQAGLNTLMVLAFVFLMLIFLSFLISQFKHISKSDREKKTASLPHRQHPLQLLHRQLLRRAGRRTC